MLIHSAVITGSVQLNNTDVSSITNVAGFATTSSVNNLQSVTGSYTTTSSFGAYTSSNDSTNTTQNTRLSTIESVTGSYATTGSNQFNGNQSISGSIVSNGTITAQTLVVQTVTSSIEFVTGSTRNGSLSSNTHQFTGSVLVSGSVGIGTSSPYGQLTIQNIINNLGGLNFSQASDAASRRWQLRNDTDVYGDFAIRQTTTQTGETFVNRLYISSSGNIGIGT